MTSSREKFFKFFSAIVLCLLARLVPARVPNVEPIMATVMPFGKAYGALYAVVFTTSSIILYDTITHTLGVNTIFTLLAYGLIALWSAAYFKKNNGGVYSYVKFSIMGTLAFDAMTGPTIGPIFFHQSFLGSIIGQIPFTLLHLLGNIIFAILLSPAIDKILIKKKSEQQEKSIINKLHPKLI